jgi:hypothetical protein
MGQLKSLRKALGDLTPDVVNWIVDPINWWRFSQQAKASFNVPAPPHPHVGFLLKYCGFAKRFMCSEL